MPNCTLSVSPCTTLMFSIGMPSRSDTSCAKVVSWPWPWLCEPVRTSTEPVGLTRTSADSHKPDAGAERADRLRRRDAAGLDIGREADAAQLAVARGFALALAEALDVGKLQRLLQRGVIVAGVVGHDHRRLVREGLDEVLACAGRPDRCPSRARRPRPAARPRRSPPAARRRDRRRPARCWCRPHRPRNRSPGCRTGPTAACA